MATASIAQNKIFHALADPSRRGIFESLTRGEAAVKDLTARFDISQPAVSQHLRVLKDAGLVVDRPAGNRRIYCLGMSATPEEVQPRWEKAQAEPVAPRASGIWGVVMAAGTLNKTGTLIFTATRVGKDTALARINDMVKRAQSSKPSIGRLADKIASVFVPAVMVIAVSIREWILLVRKRKPAIMHEAPFVPSTLGLAGD